MTPYLVVWLDVGSWWLTKFVPSFSVAVVVAGATLGLALAVQIAVSPWTMWMPVRFGGSRGAAV